MQHGIQCVTVPAVKDVNYLVITGIPEKVIHKIRIAKVYNYGRLPPRSIRFITTNWKIFLGNRLNRLNFRIKNIVAIAPGPKDKFVPVDNFPKVPLTFLLGALFGHHAFAGPVCYNSSGFVLIECNILPLK